MGLAFDLALRHLATSRRGGFLGRVSLLATAGVAVGVATLLTVFAFVQGFEAEVLSLLTDMNPGVFVSAAARGGIGPDDPVLDTVAATAGVSAVSPFIQQKGVLSTRSGRSTAAVIDGRGTVARNAHPRRTATSSGPSAR